MDFLVSTTFLFLAGLAQLLQHDLRRLSPTIGGRVVFSGIFAIGLGILAWNYAVRSRGTMFGVTLTGFARRSGRDDAGFDVFRGRRVNPPPDDLRAGRFSGGKRPDSF